MSENLYKDFKLFARDRGLSSHLVDDVTKSTENILTPYILKERTLNVSSLDIFLF